MLSNHDEADDLLLTIIVRADNIQKFKRYYRNGLYKKIKKRRGCFSIHCFIVKGSTIYKKKNTLDA